MMGNTFDNTCNQVSDLCRVRDEDFGVGTLLSSQAFSICDVLF
jgi:hypothetical protein